MKKKRKHKRQLVAKRYYSNIANCWTKFPAIFRGAFGFFRYVRILHLFHGLSRNC